MTLTALELRCGLSQWRERVPGVVYAKLAARPLAGNPSPFEPELVRQFHVGPLAIGSGDRNQPAIRSGLCL